MTWHVDDLRELECRAAELVGYHVRQVVISPAVIVYQLMRAGDSPHLLNHFRSAEDAWRLVPAYATDLNACWRDLVPYLTVRGDTVLLNDIGDEVVAHIFVKSSSSVFPRLIEERVSIAVAPPAHPAEAVLRAFLKAMEEEL